MKTIDIDWDIHKLIEVERRGFDEPPYVALRRLLKLPAPELKPEIAPVTAGTPWTEDGVVIPHGSKAKMEYLRGAQIYEGEFLNGALVVGGQSFDTLSAAASGLAVTKDGKKTSLNGWNYWSVKLPGQPKWRPMSEMRHKRGR
ncbi:hypothetical protein ACETRX_34470 [Labrys portucalensis]|uniref:RAMA domain-containing protein n=1 Tax=Labrys neptuniae TaxID=376174 RepID=A0ABV6ZRI6_9HYPH